MGFGPSKRYSRARKRYRPDEIVAKPRQVEVLQSHGMAPADAMRQIGASEADRGAVYVVWLSTTLVVV